MERGGGGGYRDLANLFLILNMTPRCVSLLLVTVIEAMARVVRVFKTLRNHWKKSTVGFCLLAYGSHWMYGKYW